MNQYKLHINKKNRKHIFLKNVGNLFTHTVGVFCILLEPPKCHITQQTKMLPDCGVFGIVLIFPLLAPLGGSAVHANLQSSLACEPPTLVGGSLDP